MPTLVIMRHAEALPSRPHDHARPLTARGRKDAADSGARILAILARAPLVLASDARRTRETAELAFSTAEPAAEIRTDAALYAAPVEVLVKALQALPESADTVALVGHNPGLSTLAKELLADGSAEEQAWVEAGLPTAGVVIYTFDEPWPRLEKGKGRLTATAVPQGAD